MYIQQSTLPDGITGELFSVYIASRRNNRHNNQNVYMYESFGAYEMLWHGALCIVLHGCALKIPFQ